MRGASRGHSDSVEAKISLAWPIASRNRSIVDLFLVAQPPSKVKPRIATAALAPSCFITSSTTIARLKPLLSRSAQKFQNVSVASCSPCTAFSERSGGAPYTRVAWRRKSRLERRARPCSSSQLLSSGPPAIAIFLPRRSATLLMVELGGTITAPTVLDDG